MCAPIPCVAWPSDEQSPGHDRNLMHEVGTNARSKGKLSGRSHGFLRLPVGFAYKYRALVATVAKLTHKRRGIRLKGVWAIFGETQRLRSLTCQPTDSSWAALGTRGVAAPEISTLTC